MNQLSLVWNARAQLGEGPIWHRDRLLWIDITGRRLHSWIPRTKERQTLELPCEPGTVVPCKDGHILIADENGFLKINPVSYDRIHLKAPPEFSKTGRMNDGKCDPFGRLWVGSMPLNWGEDSGLLYRMDADMSCHIMLRGIRCSNGIAWSNDKSRMYYIDTPTGCIDAFDYDADNGEISNRRTVVQIENKDGLPDGMTIDKNGRLWVGMWNGWSVRCFDPDNGREVERIEVPSRNVTACAFGGEMLDELYITTARSGIDPSELEQFPESGGLFMCKPGVAGIPANEFSG